VKGRKWKPQAHRQDARKSPLFLRGGGGGVGGIFKEGKKKKGDCVRHQPQMNDLYPFYREGQINEWKRAARGGKQSTNIMQSQGMCKVNNDFNLGQKGSKTGGVRIFRNENEMKLGELPEKQPSTKEKENRRVYFDRKNFTNIGLRKLR